MDIELRRIEQTADQLPDALDVDVMVFPRERDGERGLYHDSTITMVKELRLQGVSARYEHPQASRGWIGEKALTPDVQAMKHQHRRAVAAVVSTGETNPISVQMQPRRHDRAPYSDCSWALGGKAPRPLRRVCVMGIAGAGKSTLAVELGAAIDAPVVHLDAIYWKTGAPADPGMFRQEQRALIAQDRWVMDGNYSAAGGLQERLARADAVVYIEVGTWVALRRILWRAVRSPGASQHGNPGGVSWEFLRWVWTWHRKHDHLIEAVREGLGDKPLFLLRSSEDTEALLLEVRYPTP